MFKTSVRKLAKWAGVPLILAFLAIALSMIFFFNSDINPNVLSFNHATKNIQSKGKVIYGKFTAAENYLGVVTLRFDKTASFSGDSVFKIKKVLDNDWYHVATIAAFQNNVVTQYAFGLPLIAASKNKVYQFEISPVDSKSKRPHLILSTIYPVLISQYQFPKNILLENKLLLLEFIRKKLSYYAFDESSWKVFAVYSIPFILSLLYTVFAYKLKSLELIVKGKKKLISILNPYMLFIFFCMCVDIFIIRRYSDLATLILTILWILGVAAFHLESRYSIGFAQVLFILYALFLSVNIGWIAEKLVIWAYIFLIIGIVQMCIEFNADKSSKVHVSFGKINFAPTFVTYFISLPVICTKRIIDFVLSLIIYINSSFITCTKKAAHFALFKPQNFIKTLVIFVITIILLIIGFDFYLRAMSYRDRLMKNPRITKMEPTLVYPATKIIIFGDSFGDNSNGAYALMRNGIKIRTDYWEDHKIIFTVPLSWKQPGKMMFWIEKPVDWGGKIVIEKTEPMSVRLLRVTGQFTPDDDLYFEQIKTWKKETREINGYK